MKLPDESLIEAAVSELQSHAGFDDTKETREKHLENCEVCQIMQEFSKRSEAAGSERVCQIDQMIFNISHNYPFVAMICSTPGPGHMVIDALTEVGRVCYLLGVKSARSQEELKKMEALYGLPGEPTV